MNKKSVSRRDFIFSSVTAVAGVSMLPGVLSFQSKPDLRPNILWITSEDNSPFLGCYGDEYATTPNLDKFSKESIFYESAFANTPVCAPARFTILTGMYASSIGTENMRSRYNIPEFVKPLPILMREAGYYCTNPGKTDYNYNTNQENIYEDWNTSDKSFWNKGTYKDRKKGQPFFHITNITVSHESSAHKPIKLKHDPNNLTLPPYHPDNESVRNDHANYYDKIEEMDAKVGKILDQLEKDGLAEDTIVFYYADHGGILCRSKRFLYDSGTRVPMIIRFPKKFQHFSPGKPGSKTDRVISFVDLAPTLLNLAGMDIPKYIQGKAFLGNEQSAPSPYVFLFRGRMDERFDMMRAVRDKRFKYIRNYFPHRIYGQHLEYLWRANTTKIWEQEYKAGRCNKSQSIFWESKPTEELFDTKSDPWEVNNLAENPDYENILLKMREANNQWVRKNKDAGFIPEGEMIERAGRIPIHDFIRNKNVPIEKIIETAEIAGDGDPTNLKLLIPRLDDSDSAVRFWAATGCVILGEKVKSAIPKLKALLNDNSGDVAVTAAEALSLLGESKLSFSVLLEQLRNSNSKVALRSANVFEVLGDKAIPFIGEMKKIIEETDDDYVKRALSWTVEKLEMTKIH
ncbi:MAG: sulfatase-like hydrolase/transferase [Melioribacteraceae bacterium]|nr:sulfatase-like hydrolase/transferase [Melioribacteraceae bacterium]MCF8263146.1 sulfatase-like hydrolase/transferase [Melioribacteraceae bacterium]MCF8430376.1 sulfatase-like hydrolase/transferase [Melioribacteraceae bacterium]